MTLLLLLATSFLAYANGANDNFKGVASLFGSRTATYRVAIAWATITTFGGSIASIFFAQTLLMKFSGKGIVADQMLRSEAFVLAVALGAGGTVIIATMTGFPVSTTHALTGAITGSALAANAGFRLDALGKGFFVPLLISPPLALLLAAPVYLVFRYFPKRSDSGTTARSAKLMYGAHFLSAGIVSFARGLNDTPKIAALLLVVQSFRIGWSLVAVALMMALGGLLNARRVAETMSMKITSLNASQGLVANLSTGLLVVLATAYGLPVSTTHVSVGSLCGVGLTTGNANASVLVNIFLSWLLTLPCAAFIGGLVYLLVS